MRRNLTPLTLRARIAAYVRDKAREREQDGDPEGAGIMRDMAQHIGRMRLTEDA